MKPEDFKINLYVLRFHVLKIKSHGITGTPFPLLFVQKWRISLNRTHLCACLFYVVRLQTKVVFLFDKPILYFFSIFTYLNKNTPTSWLI